MSARTQKKPVSRKTVKRAVQRLDSHTTVNADDLLSDAWSLLACTLPCLDDLAQPADPEKQACQPADIAVIVRLVIEKLARATAVLDGTGGAR